jgi:hypothetical protein
MAVLVVWSLAALIICVFAVLACREAWKTYRLVWRTRPR